MNFSIEQIKSMIYTIRGMRVMLDRDLAKLYGCPTSRINEAVKRNQQRFPDDFLIIPTINELSELRSQIAISSDLNTRNLVFKNPPNLFTENGVAMLSSVLHSEHAITINIAIMRTFTKLRSFLTLGSPLESRVTKLENETKKIFQHVFEKLDNIEQKINTYEEELKPKLPKNRKRIGLNKN